MKSKKCFKCNVDKPLSEYYKHSQMGDGHLNKCKDCTKLDTKIRTNVLVKDSEWYEKEKERQRLKHKRLNYSDKYKQTPENKRLTNERYAKVFPEKRMAKNKTGNIKPIIEGNHLHHWSYNEQHYKDVIELSKELHYKAHRYMIYDKERMMYRRTDNNVLLDTKESHMEYIETIKTKP